MVKIFRYECKRLLWNKFFFGILAVTLFYGWQVLTGASILGVSHTAPFSPWTFGDYLSRLLPLLWIGVLFFLTFFTSGAERRAAVLTAATPVRPWQYALARLGAALTGTVLQSLAVLLLSAVFYARMFRWYSWGSLFLPAAISLIPALVFALGSGWLLGRLRPWLVYLWMPLPFLLQLLPLPELLSLWNGRFFSQYPLSLGTLDPAFSLPGGMCLVQSGLLAAGVVLLMLLPVLVQLLLARLIFQLSRSFSEALDNTLLTSLFSCGVSAAGGLCALVALSDLGVLVAFAVTMYTSL